MKSIYLIIFVICISSVAINLFGQGCVAVRNMASSCAMAFDSTDEAGPWQLSINYRYFRSYKHFGGTEEHTFRVEQGTEVINHDNSVLVGISYHLNKRWSFSATIPYMSIDRSSLYEHYGNTPGNPRFHTQSKGFGDVRLSGYYSILRQKKVTLTLGTGVKLPTGNYHVRDYFHKLDDEGQEYLAYNFVDQSIQLGDGGFGITTEFSASYVLSDKFLLYASGLYLLNPRNTNGVRRSANLTSNQAGQPIPLSNEFSVADQYMLRTGTTYNVAAFQISLGGRMECVTVRDLLGDEDGFRRPGYIISAEPSVFYTAGKHTVGLNFPVALERNRTRSYLDIQRGIETNPNSRNFGKPAHGDAAFADWLLSVSYAYRM